MNITKYVGKLVYDYNYNKALKTWNNRTDIDMTITKKKGTLYIQADGASVNTRIEAVSYTHLHILLKGLPEHSFHL